MNKSQLACRLVRFSRCAFLSAIYARFTPSTFAHSATALTPHQKYTAQLSSPRIRPLHYSLCACGLRWNGWLICSKRGKHSSKHYWRWFLQSCHFPARALVKNVDRPPIAAIDDSRQGECIIPMEHEIVQLKPSDAEFFGSPTIINYKSFQSLENHE